MSIQLPIEKLYSLFIELEFPWPSFINEMKEPVAMLTITLCGKEIVTTVLIADKQGNEMYNYYLETRKYSHVNENPCKLIDIC